MNSTDANLSAEVGYGLIVVDGDALSAGAIPDPIGDEQAPWVHQERRVLLPPSDSQQHLKVDTKVKRRFQGNDQSLILVIDNDDAAQGIEYAFGYRLLFAL